MADMIPVLDMLVEGQAQTRTAINELFDPMSSAALFGRRAATSNALTWGYYGGTFTKADGTFVAIANGTLALSASATNYVEASSLGVVSKNTSGFTAGKIPLYTVTTGTDTVTNYVDHRDGMQGNFLFRGGVFGASGTEHSAGLVPDPGATPGTTKYLREDGTWAEIAAAGTVSSVDLAAPAEFVVSGNPVTASGTLTLTKATQAAHLVWAGPATGTAVPTFRALTYGDLPAGVGPGKPRVQAVTYAASVTLDCAVADVFTITLTGNIAIAFENAVDGQKVEVRLKQDATGSRLVTWDAAVAFGTDLTSADATATTTANARDKYGFEYDAGATKYDLISLARGY